MKILCLPLSAYRREVMSRLHDTMILTWWTLHLKCDTAQLGGSCKASMVRTAEAPVPLLLTAAVVIHTGRCHCLALSGGT